MVVIESVCLRCASRVSFSSLLMNSKSILACMQTLFYFPFRSFAKLPQVREQGEHASEVCNSECGAQERLINSSPPPLPPCAGGQ